MWIISAEKTVEILDTEPLRIHEVPTLKPKLADNLIDVWSKNRSMRNLLIYLQGLGISAKIAQRIFNEYGAQTQQVVENNPYQLAQDVFTIGFRKADQIARNLGVEVDASTACGQVCITRSMNYHAKGIPTPRARN